THGMFKGIVLVKMDIFSLSKWLIPVNVEDRHWALITLDFMTKTIYYFDSLSIIGDIRLEATKLILDVLSCHWGFLEEHKLSGKGQAQYWDMSKWSTMITEATKHLEAFMQHVSQGINLHVTLTFDLAIALTNLTITLAIAHIDVSTLSVTLSILCISLGYILLALT
ncbi:hypothetical protein FRB99_007396, partial [Tulasnella sp. 403]